MSRYGMAGFLRPSPGGSASGFFVPKPSTGADCQHRSIPGLGQTVRGRPLASTAVRGDCHSLCHSAVREPVVSGCCPTRFPSLRLCVQPCPPPTAICMLAAWCSRQVPRHAGPPPGPLGQILFSSSGGYAWPLVVPRSIPWPLAHSHTEVVAHQPPQHHEVDQPASKERTGPSSSHQK
jgi:hypothetical protein